MVVVSHFVDEGWDYVGTIEVSHREGNYIYSAITTTLPESWHLVVAQDASQDERNLSVKHRDINRLLARPEVLVKVSRSSPARQHADRYMQIESSFQPARATISGLRFQVKILIIDRNRFPGSLLSPRGITHRFSGTRAKYALARSAAAVIIESITSKARPLFTRWFLQFITQAWIYVRKQFRFCGQIFILHKQAIYTLDTSETAVISKQILFFLGLALLSS